MGLIQLHVTWNWWPFSPSLVTSSQTINCSQNLKRFWESGLLWFCSSSMSLSTPLAFFWKMILFHPLPPLQTPRPLILCRYRTISFTNTVELLCLHYRHKSLHSCSSPHPLPDWNTKWVLWSLLILEDKLNMPTVEPGEELCTQIWTCAVVL